MKLIIFQPTFNKLEEIDNPSFIPRVGERIAIWYAPAPTVKEVIYDFAEMKVVVTVE